MKLGSGKAWARTLGSAFAHLQHGIDKTIEWGFDKMQQQANEPVTQKKTTNKYLRNAKSAARSTINFVGQLGQHYYEKYEELKKES